MLPDNFLSNNFRFASPILAANAIVYFNDTTVVAVSRPDRKKLWKIKLPASPMANGMSLTRTGEVLVPLNDGRIVCIGLADPTPKDAPASGDAKDSVKKSVLGSEKHPAVIHEFPETIAKLEADTSKWANVAALPAPFSKRDAGMMKLAWRDEGLYGLIEAKTAHIDVDEATPWAEGLR